MDERRLQRIPGRVLERAGSGITTPPRPIGRYYAFEATQAAAFTLPIFVVYFQFRGLGLAEVGLIEAVYTVVSLTVEWPTGYLGDRLGRRRTLLASATLAGGGAVAFALAASLWAFLAVIVVRAVAGALRSGTGDAWLYETLAADPDCDRDRFAAYRGRAGAIRRATTALSVLAGGALYALAPVAPWVVEGAVVGLGGLLALSLPEPPRVGDRPADADGTGPAGEAPPTPATAFRGALGVLAGAGLRRFVAYTAVVFAVCAGVHVLTQPAAVDLPDLRPAHLGGLYFAMVSAAAVAADRTEWIRRRIGIDGWFALAPPLVGVSLLVSMAVPAAVLVAFVAVRTLRSVSGPLASKYVNDRTAGARATTLSGAATVRGFVVAPTKLVAGAAATGSIALAVAGLGGMLVLAGGTVAVLGGPTGEERSAVSDRPRAVDR